MGIEKDEQALEAKEKTNALSEQISENFSRHQTAELLAVNEALLKTKQDKTKLLMIGFGVMTCLFIITLIAWASYPKNRFVAMTDASQICNVTPENNPNLNDKAIANFAQEAVLHTNSFSYADYEEKIEWAMSNYYNTDGRRKATAGMRSSEILNSVRNNLFTIKSTVNGIPSVADINKKELEWTVRVPMRIEIYGATKEAREVQEVLATVTVSAKNASSQNATGLGVSNVTYERIK